MAEYGALLNPGNIATLTLKNRIILAAMGSNLCEPDGHCSQRLIDYYAARAKGGCGMLILETSAVAWPRGASMPNTLGFSKDEFIPGLQKLTSEVHQYGSKIAAQLNHSGKVAQEDTAAGRELLVPSMPKKRQSDMGVGLTQDEIATFIKAAGPAGEGPQYRIMQKRDIDWVIQQFAAAAQRAQAANFDAVEIHAGHGYLLAAFLSLYSNQREDEYGGPIENRARLLLEVIAAVRRATGDTMPIICRIDAHEYHREGGIEIADAVALSHLLKSAGVAAIDVSAYSDSSSAIGFTEAPLVHKENGFLEFARTIKKAVAIPVIAVGRVEPETAAKDIGRGDYDFLTMGRKLLADPELPNKLSAGHAKDIRPCIYCYVCVSQIFLNRELCCAANPATGQEAELGVISPVAKAKRILVVGGGPAGLEAARVLSLRGHSVTLWERERKLGGTARVAALAYAPNGKLLDYLEQAVRNLPVQIELNTIADEKSILAFAPDHLVVATGAKREAPHIPGKELRHVFDGDELRGLLFGGQGIEKLPFYQQLLINVARHFRLLDNINLLRKLSRIYMPLGKKIVIIGGGLVGLEVAEMLIERDRQVTVLEPSANLGPELSVVRRWRVLRGLTDHDVDLRTNVNIERIDSTGVHTVADNKQSCIEADNIIIALGAVSHTQFSDLRLGEKTKMHHIGDCAEVGYIEGAQATARKLALSLN